MAAPNVFKKAYPEPPAPVSKTEFIIGGIQTSVFGLDELPQSQEVSCLWLLHPRGATREVMDPFAAAVIGQWNRNGSGSSGHHGLICASFDQRNHGTRMVDDRANQDWRGKNPTHGIDMFGSYQGTATDTSQLIGYLPGYIFPNNEHFIKSNSVMGVSLGGHAAWHCVLHDHRINTAVVIIGCPDYTRLMQHRAEKSKLETWLKSDPPGSKFLGSKDFPRALQEAVDRWDPAGLLMGEMLDSSSTDFGRDPSEREKKKLMPLMRDHLQGKRIFNAAGGADKLVPHACAVPFIKWLSNAIRPSGWYSGQGVVFKDKVYDGAGHEVTADMVRDSVDFIIESLLKEKNTVAKI